MNNQRQRIASSNVDSVEWRYGIHIIVKVRQIAEERMYEKLISSRTIEKCPLIKGIGKQYDESTVGLGWKREKKSIDISDSSGKFVNSIRCDINIYFSAIINEWINQERKKNRRTNSNIVNENSSESENSKLPRSLFEKWENIHGEHFQKIKVWDIFPG